MSQIPRRRFLLHPAHSTIGASASLTCPELDCPAVSLSLSGQSVRPLEVCVASEAAWWGPDGPVPALETHLEERFNCNCSRALLSARGDLLGIENIQQADCLMLCVGRLPPGRRAFNHIVHYHRGGGPVLGITGAGPASEGWRALQREIFAADCLGRWGDRGKLHVQIAKAAKDHPVLQGVRPFGCCGRLRRHARLAADVNVLLEVAVGGHAEPVAWTRLPSGGRVFYTSLGSADHFRRPGFLRLLANAVFWTTGRRPEPR